MWLFTSFPRTVLARHPGVLRTEEEAETRSNRGLACHAKSLSFFGVAETPKLDRVGPIDRAAGASCASLVSVIRDSDHHFEGHDARVVADTGATYRFASVGGTGKRELEPPSCRHGFRAKQRC
jgi:hypothetical protein